MKRLSRVLTIFVLFVTVLSFKAHAKYTATVNVDTLDVNMYSVVNAYLYGDGSLIFDYKPDPSLGYVEEEFLDVGSVDSTVSVPWDHVRNQITRVEYRNGVNPEHREYWFIECNNLKSMVLPDNATRVCDGEFVGSGITGNIVIPEGITDIGKGAFAECWDVTGYLSLPSTLKSIQDFAFCGNCIIGDLIIPDSVEYIGADAFNLSERLSGSLKLPNNLRRIGRGAFGLCSSLTGDLIIPDSVEEIGVRAFLNCSGLSGNLVIPDSVRTISSEAFSGCSGLSGKLILSNSLTTIEPKTFENCTGINTVIMPRNLVSIKDFAFKNVSAHTIDFNGANVSSMAQGCFLHENGYIATTLLGHNSYVDGYNWALDNRGITGKVNAYLYSDGNLVFDLYPSGSNGTLVATYNNVGTSEYMSDSDVPWNSERGRIRSVEYRNGVAPVHREYWFAHSGLNSIVVPDGADRICKYEFSGSNIDRTSVPEGITVIDENAFSWCSFDGISLPSSLQRIEDYAFAYNFNYYRIEIPDGVSYIGNSAFENCMGMNSNPIKIPSRIRHIGSRAFAEMPRLNSIFFGNTNIEYIGSQCFYVSSISDGSIEIPVVTYLDTSNPVVVGYDWAGDNRIPR